MKKTVILSILFVLFSIPILAQAKIPSEYIIRTFIDEEGNSIDEIIVPGRPPVDHREPAVELPDPSLSDAINILSNVPAFDWSYGCSATSGAMIAGFYDNGSYPNMYTGPANGGVVPMDNSIWGSGECPLSATHQGYDGLTVRGHVDDYWYSYSSSVDPYYGNWTEHGYADCTSDYMGTNQYINWQNTDGSTIFFNYTNGIPLYNYTGCEPDQKDGCHGLREFFESRGYSIQSNGNYSQYIYGYSGNTLGFTYDQFKAEIDAGRPVMIQVAGHSMVGFGYDDNTNLVYLHNTWDYSNHTMIWGGSYSGMQHYAVTVFILEPESVTLNPPTNFNVTDVGFATWDAPSGGAAGTLSHHSGYDNNGIGIGGAASWICAARFDATDLATYYGSLLTDVNIHIRTADFSYVEARVYEGGSFGDPGTLVYSQDITSSVLIENWTNHVLTTPIPLVVGIEYWIGYYMDATGEHPASVDAGPAVPGKGDWMYYDGAWVEISTQYGLDYNWCIEGVVGGTDNTRDKVISKRNIFSQPPGSMVTSGIPEAAYNHLKQKYDRASDTPALLGYNVYLNGVYENFTTDLFWQYTGLTSGVTYTAGVSALYDESESSVIEYEFTYNPGGIYTLPFAEEFDGATYPPTDWSIIGMNPGNWSSSASDNAGGTSPESRFSWTPDFIGESALTSPIINTSGLNTIELAYKQFLDDYSGDSYSIGVRTTSNGGATWNILSEIFPTGDIGPEVVNLTVNTPDVGSSSFQFAFFFNGNSSNLDDWYIDDVYLTDGNDPNISVAPNFFNEELVSGDSSIQELTIYNDGNGDLNWSINTEGQQYIIAFDDAYAANGHGSEPEAYYGSYGIHFDNTAGYGIIGGMGNGDPGNWDLEGTNGSALWGIWDGEHSIWIDGEMNNFSIDFCRGHQDYSVTVYAYLDGSIVDIQTVELSGAFDFETVSFADPIDIIMWNPTVGGSGVDNIQFTSDDLSYTPSKNISQYYNPEVHQKTENGGVLINSHFYSTNQIPEIYSDIKPGGYQQKKSIENYPSNARETWLIVEPNNGTTPPGSSETIQVTFDATDLTPDVYTADINITSNDPDEPLVTVPATLEVTGGLTPPTNLTADLDEVTGEVYLNWNYGTGSGFYEDFEDGVADNFVFSDTRFTADNGYLKMNGYSDNTWASACYNETYSDFTMEFEVTRFQSESTLPVYIGAFIRANGFMGTGNHNGYLISITANGSYSAWLNENGTNGTYTSIIPWTSSSYINTGLGASNIVTIDAYGPNFDIYINGNYVNSFTDYTFPSGYVNLTTYDTDDGTNEIWWDYVEVTTGALLANLQRPEKILAKGVIVDEDITHCDGEIINNPFIPVKGLINRSDLTLSHSFQYFNVYRDGTIIDTTTATSYTDNLTDYGTYEYEVTANYDVGESSLAGPVIVTWTPVPTTLSGNVTSSQTGVGIEGAVVTLGGISDVTDSDGYYLLDNVPVGELTVNFMGTPTTGNAPLIVQFMDLSTDNTQTVNATATGYIDYTNSQVVIEDGQQNILGISLSPILSENEMRFVLNWGADPSDLDSHLKTPEIEGNSYHVYYYSKGDNDAPPFASLDYDDVTGYGPETITIYQSYSGTYQYYIHKYAGIGELTTSNAVVQIYNESELIQTVQVPTSGEGLYWYVCDINGNTQNITLINQIVEEAPGFIEAPMMTTKDYSSDMISSNGIVSWLWHFGDGYTSNNQHPEYTYSLPGEFTVSLTVNDGTTERTETKNDYIIVVPVANPDISLTIPSTEGPAGNVVSIPVAVDSGFTNVAMCELHVTCNTTLLSYTGMVSDYLSSGDVNEVDGIINIVWIYSGTPMQVPDGDTLILFNFQVSADATEGQTCRVGFVGENCIGDSDENAYSLALNPGTFTVISGYGISGSLTYCDNGSPLIGDTLYLSGDMNENTLTDEYGYYTFELTTGSLILHPEKHDDISDINGFDLLRLKNKLLGITTLTPNALLAADCNGSGGVDGFDLLRLKNYLLMIPVDPPIATWGFTPQQYIYDPIGSDMSNQNFGAFIYGDVNLNWGTASQALAKASDQFNTNVSFSHFTLDEQGYLHLPICVDNDVQLGMIDWSISFDTTAFSFKRIDADFINKNDYNCTDNLIKLVWIYEGEEIVLEKGNMIIDLVLMPINNQHNGTVGFTGKNYLATANEKPIQAKFGSITINLSLLSLLEDGQIPTETTLYENYPNPFNPSTQITYYLKEDSRVTMNIYNLRGEKVYSLDQGYQSPGLYQIIWDACDNSGKSVSSGIYLYQLVYEFGMNVKRMIYMK